LTNLIGNGVATIVIAKWDGSLNARRMNRILNGQSPDPDEVSDEPERLLVTEAHAGSKAGARLG
jgi:aerobic C4-dicarboxylate transport protein